MSLVGDRLKQPKLSYFKKDGENLILDEDFNFKIGLIEFTIPKGFTCDGASVPKLVKLLFPAWLQFLIVIPVRGFHDRAWIVHDWMYYKRGQIHDISGQLRIYTRKRTDKIFLKRLKESQVKFLKRRAAYKAVRIGGQEAWDED